MSKVVARWGGSKLSFEIESGSGHKLTIDEPPPLGDDSGMRPTELLLAALSACTGVNAASLLNKFKQPFDQLAVEVEGDQGSEWPRAFTDIRITFAIHWTGPRDDALVDKALDLSCNRYCPVDATLTNGVRITHTKRDL
ncbi:MAG TPA: OsmC family protein [Candidatus Dormibacteraeota bacterium]|jgi:putative redox protein|nr:OsmC family protein [Candidatus Dormibacteraeota bacterium]